MNEGWIPNLECSKDMSRGKARRELEAIMAETCLDRKYEVMKS